MNTSRGLSSAKLCGMERKPRRTFNATDWLRGFWIARRAMSMAVSPDPRTRTRLFVNMEDSLYCEEWIIWPLNVDEDGSVGILGML